MSLKRFSHDCFLTARRARYSIRTLSLLLGILVIGLIGLTSRAELPTEAAQSVYSDADYREALLSHWKKTILDNYKSNGDHNPKWDAQATGFLEEYLCFFCNRVLKSQPFEVGSQEALLAKGQAVLTAGCHDPMIEFAIGDLMYRHSPEQSTLPHMGAAMMGLADKGYPPLPRLLALNWLVRNVRDYGGKTHNQLIDLRDIAFYDCAKTQNNNGVVRRMNFDQMMDVLNTVPNRFRPAMLNRLTSQSDTDRWIANTMTGSMEIFLAWEARTSQVAAHVTEEQWKGFRQHLDVAKRSLYEALDQQPNYPEPCTLMVQIAAAGEDGDHKPRYWFDKSAAIQIDSIEAYENYIGALRPRWSGSYSAMVEFGRECARTQRFKTQVPWQLVTVINAIKEDRSGDYDVLEVPEITDALCNVFSGYLEQTRDQARIDLLTSQWIGALWRARRYDEAADLRKKFGRPLSPDGLFLFDALPMEVEGSLAAMTSPHAADLRKADNTVLLNRDYAGAAKIYEKVAKQLPATTPAGQYVIGMWQTLLDKAAFAKGEWVNLLPKGKGTVHTFGAKPKIEKDGSLVITTGGAGGTAAVIPLGQFGPHFEAEIDIEQISSKAGPTDSPSEFGVGLWANDSDCQYICIDPVTNSRYTFYKSPSMLRGSDERIAPQKRHLMNLKFGPGKVVWFFDGERVQNGGLFRPLGYTHRVVLIGRVGEFETVYKIRTFRIRQCLKDPED